VFAKKLKLVETNSPIKYGKCYDSGAWQTNFIKYVNEYKKINQKKQEIIVNGHDKICINGHEK